MKTDGQLGNKGLVLPIAKCYNNKGNAMANLGKYCEAIDCYNKAIGWCANDENDSFYVDKIMINKAIVISESGEDEKAILIFDELIKKHLDDMEVNKNETDNS